MYFQFLRNVQITHALAFRFVHAGISTILAATFCPQEFLRACRWNEGSKFGERYIAKNGSRVGPIRATQAARCCFTANYGAPIATTRSFIAVIYERKQATRSHWWLHIQGVLRNDRTPLNTPYTPQLMELHLNRHEVYDECDEYVERPGKELVTMVKSKIVLAMQPVYKIQCVLYCCDELYASY